MKRIRADRDTAKKESSRLNENFQFSQGTIFVYNPELITLMPKVTVCLSVIAVDHTYFNYCFVADKMSEGMVEAPDHCPGTGTELSGKADACEVLGHWSLVIDHWSLIIDH